MNNTNEMTTFCWYENGQKKVERNFMDGKLNKQHRNNQ